MRTCLKCHSENIHPSRSRTKWEAWRKEITGKRIFRCHACGWRGWGVDEGPIPADVMSELAARTDAPDPPNLAGTVLARERRTDDVNLDALDLIDAVGEKEN